MMALVVSLAPLIAGIVMIALLAHFGPRLSHRTARPSVPAAGSLANFAAGAARRDDPGPVAPKPSSPSS
jgi:hypothetical protein